MNQIDFSKLNYRNVFDLLDNQDLTSVSKDDLIKLRNRVEEFSKLWDIKNNIYKVNVINSLYGILDNKDSPIHNYKNAEAVTSCGQLCIRGVSNHITKNLGDVARCFYSDTDSVFVSQTNIPINIPSKEFVEKTEVFAQGQLVPAMKNYFNELAVKTNTTNRIKMDVESYCDQVIMHSPKMYIARLIKHKGVFHDKSEYYFKIKGMSLIRSDTPAWCKDKIYKSLNIIFDGTNDDMFEYIKKNKEEFMSLSLAEIAKPTSANDMKKYTFDTKGAPRHIKSALIYNKFLEDNGLTGEYQPIFSGAKIAVCYIKKVGAIRLGYDGIAINLNDKIPPQLLELIGDEIDYELMWEKVFVKPLERIMNDVGWSFEKRNDFFDEL